MNKLLVVKEFDVITKNASYKDDSNYKYLPKDVFDNLIDFIHGFSFNDPFTDILDFMKVGYKRNIGDTIIIKNYVGIIQMKNGYQIEILPKVSFSTDEDLDNVKTKKIFLKMLHSMKNFPSKVFNDASLQINKMNLYEIFINMYLQEVIYLVKHGIKSSYILQEKNIGYYKGKLHFSKHINENLAHKEKFYVIYDEFHPNRAENKIVKTTLLKLKKLTSSFENAKTIRQLLTYFEMIEPSTNITKDFLKVRIDRNTKDYKTLMEWSKVFLLDKSFTTFSGKNTSKTILFPMESVYESYVAKNIYKIMSSYGWKVSLQDKGYYLFEEPKKQFSLRPDIVLTKDERILIMDTKWKKLINNERSNYGISQLDMYQMYTYSKKYKAKEIWLLYPINEEFKNGEEISFDSGDGTTVNIFFINLENIEESLNILKNRIEPN